MNTDIAIVVVALLIFMYSITRYEGFTTKREKADAIMDYFKKDETPDYVTYKKTLGGKSDIIEYDDARKLDLLGRLTTLNLERVL